ncbi:hypothetical protein DM02DRAFT_248598 [Periconia macrospinosa]|uniref:Uncharacterized protein n=1 Tax=Periconia macrospinosa TaxID=97972 RepID=A0A2V1D7C7_9PLEO|nr:hypothetical protein DM02DRAFT_248598 [Periconia macrospinosa]
MSAVKGEKTASSFQHQFRSMVKKAKALKTRVENSEKFTLVVLSGKRGATTTLKVITSPDATPWVRRLSNSRYRLIVVAVMAMLIYRMIVESSG